VARLSDLCAEDKSKIGELVKKLASESKAREDSVSRFEKEKTEFEERIKRMQAEAASF
jgi:predicted nuclease with TOPRIM domain